MQYSQLAILALALGANAARINVRADSSTTDVESSTSSVSSSTVTDSATDASFTDASFTDASSTATASATDAEETDDAEATATDDADEDEAEATASAASGSSNSSAPATTGSATLSSGDSSSGGSLPASSGTSVLDAVQTIAAGESFDGGLYVIDRGVECSGQAEGGGSDAVFILENGASLSNVIIGPNQIEGVHCMGSCKLENVWWSAVCEDAFTIKEQDAGETTTITGGGAFSAEDKVLQHNGGGTLEVSGFTVDNFGKLYRSCGNCKTQNERHVIFSDITASEGKALAGELQR